jgi:hypothetical protein
MRIDTTSWSGEGTFTQTVLDALRTEPRLVACRVEDAPATRSEADYNFISNEIFVQFERRDVREPIRRFGFLPATRVVSQAVMTMGDLEAFLATTETVGPPDYADEGMLQYLRTERIIPPYQTKGYKLVELVRIYEVGSGGPDQPDAAAPR